jgi:pimeloyl-ACP methyl ester carboxylesterase
MNCMIQTVSGLAVDERRSTSGPAAHRLIFVHGSMDTGRSFRALRDELGEYDTITYTRRGYDSPSPAAEGGAGAVERHLRDLAAVIGDRPCVLFGHSLGGVLSLAAASRRPQLVKAVVVYEAPLPWLEWWPRAPLPTDVGDPANVNAAAQGFLRRAMGGAVWEALPDAKRRTMLAWAPAWASELLELTDGSWPFDPESVKQPALVLRGEHADERQIRGSAVLSRHLPNATIGVVPDATHIAHSRRAPALAVRVREFLAGLPTE